MRRELTEEGNEVLVTTTEMFTICNQNPYRQFLIVQFNLSTRANHKPQAKHVLNGSQPDPTGLHCC